MLLEFNIIPAVLSSRYPHSIERPVEMSGWSAGHSAGHRLRVPGHFPAESGNRVQLQQRSQQARQLHHPQTEGAETEVRMNIRGE